MSVRAASVLLLVFAAGAHAQQPAPAPEALDPSRKFEIQDNSFLVEEAFNQEKGIYQNIFGFIRSRGDWDLAFTQEWPVGGQTHQFSYTIAFGGDGTGNRFGDALINYRYQLTTETDSRPAFSPRFSLILPTGGRERGYDTLGYQVNLPFSKQHRDWYFHWNAGMTSYLGVPSPEGRDVSLFTPTVAASAIWRARPMVHVMLESVFASVQDPSRRQAVLTASPGVRVGKNFGDAQMVAGAALPVTFSKENSEGALLLYFSYELPFRR